MNLQQSQSKVFNVKFSIESFKEKLDILDKYDLFFNLEKKVLKISQNNINKHSDIRISYVVNRKGRTPVSITFKAQYKKEFENKQIEFQHELNIPEPQPELEKDCDLGKEKVKGIKEMLGYKI
jgi:plasmid replication initiation protein